jgi:hypothetical protein
MPSGCTEAALDPRLRGGDIAGGCARASTVRHSRAKPALSLPKGGNPGRGQWTPAWAGFRERQLAGAL